MKLVFFGTSAFAADIFTFLFQNNYSIAAVVTRPDRPKGRSLHLSPPPVKRRVQELAPDLPIHQPEKASAPEFAEILKGYQADLFVVVAFGEIIKQNLLQLPRLGCINIHTSLLPKYRGAAPIQRALMDGALETGVTIIDMVLQMDAGDIIEIQKTPVATEMTFGELEKKLFELACSALSNALSNLEKGKAIRIPQDETQVTFAPKLQSEEEKIIWSRPAENIHNLIRALSPKPGAWCTVQIGKELKRLKILRSVVIADLEGDPGQILSYGKEGWIIACGKEALQLIEVQLEGKKLLKAEELMRGMQQPPIICP